MPTTAKARANWGDAISVPLSDDTKECSRSESVVMLDFLERFLIFLDLDLVLLVDLLFGGDFCCL